MPISKPAMMADITNTMNTSTSVNSVAGQIIASESSESVHSSGVREAVDVIFPKSASQILQRGFSFDEDKFLGVKASKENLHPGTTTQTLYASAVSVPISMSSPYTITTTCTSMTVSSEVVTSAYTNGSSALSVSSFVSTYTTAPVYSLAFKSQDEGKFSGNKCKNIKLPKKDFEMIKIADPEVVNLNTTFDNESYDNVHKKPLSTDSSIELKDCLDTENMVSTNANIVSEMNNMINIENTNSETDNLLHKNNVKTIMNISKLTEKSDMINNSQSLNSSHVDLVSLNVIGNDETTKESSTHIFLPNHITSKSPMLQFSNEESDSQSFTVKNVSINKSLHRDSGIVSQDSFINSGYSLLENLHKQRGNSQQSLPKIKQYYFNIMKHKKKIRNSFPPCFVVIKSLEMPLNKYLVEKCVTNNILALSVRLKHLSGLCDRGKITCKNSTFSEMVYRNIFEETILPDVCEEDSEIVKGKRSLRKRNKNISYIEPSEDDIQDEFSRKYKRAKHKVDMSQYDDRRLTENTKSKTNSDPSEDKRLEENKRRQKLSDQSKDESLGESIQRKKISTKTFSRDCVTMGITAIPQDCSVETNVIKDAEAILKQKYIKPLDKTISSTKDVKQIIVYPPTSTNVSNSYHVLDKVSLSSSISKVSLLSCTPGISKQKYKNSAQLQPCSGNISMLLSSAQSGAVTCQSNPFTLVPTLPYNILKTISKPAAPKTPVSTPVSSSSDPPQYCVVKVDGADVLLQFVPSTGRLIVPKGKTLLAPATPLISSSTSFFSQSQPSTLTNSTQAISSSLTSVVTTLQGNISSPPLQQQLFGTPIISTSSQNSSLPSSVVSTSQPASISSTVCMRSFDLTSGTHLTHNSTSGVPGYITVMSSLNSRITSVVTSTQLSGPPNQALSAAVTSMAAPITTTVVRSVRVPSQNLRVIAPKQSTSVRSVRIFVPGCSATGTSGHFATIRTIAKGSPLTCLASSSTLLPQRRVSSGPQLSAEQLAAKRRKLEEKYPLPPGVVIKTEPLETVTQPPSVITTMSGSRSLLPQNIQLLSSSAAATGLQSIRIISPSISNALNWRNVRGGTNIIYRAASIGGGQTVLVPASFGQMLRTTTAVASTCLSTTSSSSFSTLESIGINTATSDVAATTISVTNNVASCTTNTSAISTVLLSSSKTPSHNFSPLECYPQSQLSLSNNTLPCMPTSNSVSITDLQTVNIPLAKTSLITSSESSLITHTPFTSSITPLTACESSITTAIYPNSIYDSHLSTENQSSDAGTLEHFRFSLEKMRNMIQVQEAHGLKGERLDKLKGLLHEKELHYLELQNLTSVSASLSVAAEVIYDTPRDIIYGTNNNHNTIDGIVANSFNETDPIVID